MADGVGGNDRLTAAVFELTGEVREMRGEMKSFVDQKASALQRLEIRAEYQSMLKEATNALEEKTAVARALADQKTLEASKQYTDEQVAALVEELAAREERDQRIEARLRASIYGVIGVGTAGVAFALYQMLAGV